jgi:hypothetical protein
MIDKKTTKSSTESLTSLLRRKAQVVKDLPPLEEVLRGSFLHREIRCGKPNCRCARAKGPRHVLLCVTVSFAGGRTQQVTVPRDWVGPVKLWIENYALYWQAIEEISAINRRLLQSRQIPAEQKPRPRAYSRGRRAAHGSGASGSQPRKGPRR